MQKRRVLPPKVVTRITGLWLIGYCSVLYLGSFVAGVMTDYVSYSGRSHMSFRDLVMIIMYTYYGQVRLLRYQHFWLNLKNIMLIVLHFH